MYPAIHEFSFSEDCRLWGQYSDRPRCSIEVVESKYNFTMKLFYCILFFLVLAFTLVDLINKFVMNEYFFTYLNGK